MTFLKQLLVPTWKNWISDKAPKMAAALAYYSCFALPPLLVIAISMAGLAFGREAAMGQVVEQIQGLVGKANAETIQTILVKISHLKTGLLGTLIGAAALLFGASGVFGELQDSLNVIWKVQKKPGRGVLGTLKDRFCSLTMVMGLGFLLLISLVLSAGLSALGNWLGGETKGVVLQIVSVVASVILVSAVFTLMFRYVPDARTPFKWCLLGGGMTAAFFVAGKFVLGAYLGHSTIATSYGAAGAFLLILLWVYYSSQILFFGAELTTTLASTFGPKPKPDEDAARIVVPYPEKHHAAGARKR